MRRQSKTELIDLVQRCREGDRGAWTKFIDLVSPLIFSICRSMKLSREESFDVFGQVAYLLLTNLHRLRSPEKVLSWIGTTTRREVFALHRKSKFIEYLADHDSRNPAFRSETTPESIYDQTHRAELLMRALLSLSPRDYQLIRYLFLDSSQPSYEEIAGKLGLPVSSIGPTRARCLEKLRKMLKTKGFEP